jgi:hypothetical protein
MLDNYYQKNIFGRDKVVKRCHIHEPHRESAQHGDDAHQREKQWS